MNETSDLDRLLADWMTSTAPKTAPRGVVEDAIAATGTLRPRPIWLAYMRTPPMTTERRSRVGSPTARFAFLASLVLLAAALATAGVVMGARLIVRAEAPTTSNGLIAVDAAGDILLADPDGSQLRMLTTGSDTDTNPTFSPAGDRLAFWSTAEGGPARLVITRPDGSDMSEIAADATWSFQTSIIGTSNISWSPDGTRIATVVAGSEGRTVAVVDVAAGTLRPLDIDPLEAAFVSWSPDGEWLAYVGSRVRKEVYVIRPDGTGERSLTPTSMDAASYLSVDWSPDSSLLTYTRLEPDGIGHAAYSVAVKTGQESLIAGAPDTGSFWWPTYSPDGTRIASGGDHQGRAAVFVMPADGRGAVERVAIADPVSTEDVTWSPDGESLLVFAHDFETLFIVPVDDPAGSIGIDTGGSLWSPSWQRLEAAPPAVDA